TATASARLPTTSHNPTGNSPIVFEQDHSFPSTKSTTQHPRTCSPSLRQCFKMSALSHPASSNASASIGTVKGTVVIHGFSDLANFAVVPGEPKWVDADGIKGIAENAINQPATWPIHH